MTQPAGIAVTYTGRDDPFIDRLYRSGLTFTNGQTRTVPPVLAERFLRHSDVFQPAASAQEPAAADAGKSEAKDDTDEVLEQAQKQQDELRKKEDERFALLDQLDAMDKPALIEWALVKYQQRIHPNTGEAKVREQVKGFVDQYGAP